MRIDRILKAAVKGGASDIILKQGAIPRFRYRGELFQLSNKVYVTEDLMRSWLDEIVPARLRQNTKELEDLDFSHEMPGGSRFRVNVFRQRGQYAIVLRVIQSTVRTLEELQLPRIFEELCQLRRGLVLVTGATGSGKSTTLAAMVEKINCTRSAHIITVEDPVEMHFVEKRSTINQREIGTDTISFQYALRSALRQNPDLILVGELRDKETIETALMAAETGHLVLSTLHTTDAIETITRLLSYFPPHQHVSLRMAMATTIRAIIAQRLIPHANGSSMVPAQEIMIVNERVKEQILQGDDFVELRAALEEGSGLGGMATFDHSILQLLNRGVITRQEAIRHTSNAKDLELKLAGISK